jgi:hypothetical protein
MALKQHTKSGKKAGTLATRALTARHAAAVRGGGKKKLATSAGVHLKKAYLD